MEFFRTVEIEGTDPQADAARVLAKLADAEVLMIEPQRDLSALSEDSLRAYFDDLVEGMGVPIEAGEDYDQEGAPNGQRWQEIRYVEEIPDMAAFRHSKNAQPLHTDESYVSTGAGLMMFYCQHAAPEGGATYFVSGRQLVSELEKDDPELLADLLSRPVRFAKAGDYKDRPIIELDRDGNVDLNFNYYCADPEQDPMSLELNQRFLDYVDSRLDPKHFALAQMKPGQAAAWRDNRVLHGRRSFSATKTNERLIYKTGIVLHQH